MCIFNPKSPRRCAFMHDKCSGEDGWQENGCRWILGSLCPLNPGQPGIECCQHLSLACPLLQFASRAWTGIVLLVSSPPTGQTAEPPSSSRALGTIAGVSSGHVPGTVNSLNRCLHQRPGRPLCAGALAAFPYAQGPAHPICLRTSGLDPRPSSWRVADRAGPMSLHANPGCSKVSEAWHL